jgi:serine phosphatase RsbU (regulator of sigma subunit)
VRAIFPESFIMVYPRDIVSGDFFWVHERKTRKYIVVADCTGHGVPGALMSIIGHNLLNPDHHRGEVRQSLRHPRAIGQAPQSLP